MNLRVLTLRYMGWCPGVKAAARFVPDKEIPNKRVKQVSYIVGLIFLLYLIYYVVTPPRSYAWDLDFKDAEYDEAYKMYVTKKSGDFTGIYYVRIWVEAPKNTTVFIQLLQRTESNPRHIWTFRNEMFWNFDDPRGYEINENWELHNPYIWKVYSESRDTAVHMRVEFLRSNPDWPWGH